MPDLLTRLGAPLTIGGRFAVGTGPQSFSPLDLSPAAWYDATTVAGPDGGAVAQWDDLSGNGNHLAQSDPTRRPTLQTATVGGQSVLRFDGANDYLFNNDVAAAASESDHTIVVVAYAPTADRNQFVASFGSSTEADAWSMIGTLGSVEVTQRWRMGARWNGGAASPDTIRQVTTPSAMVYICQGSVVTYAVNGAHRTVVNSQQPAFDRFAVGCWLRVSPSLYLNGDVGEVIVYPRALSFVESIRVRDYLYDKWGFDRVDAFDASEALFVDYANEGAPLASASEISGATAVAEQDDIVHDPTADADRRYKFYYRVTVGAEARIFVKFSTDGDTWGSPVRCVLGSGDRESDDPSVVQMLGTSGQVHRDDAGKMHIYVEDRISSTTYVYESTDGVTFADMNNPAIPLGTAGSYDDVLTGSPCARHDGTQYIVGYEGVKTGYGVDDTLCLSIGATPDGLTKSANNPVWRPGADPFALTTIVADTMYENADGTAIVLTAHAGSQTAQIDPQSFRGTTTVMDPTAWVSGDIETVGGNLSSILHDITRDPTRTPNRAIFASGANSPDLYFVDFRRPPAIT